ncbi:autotransporter outer membrane beta-barrel domain-containing protein, partial [Roseobacter sp. HKCCD7581]|uniref:autotransporter outer membrane beta-barrel domain-containing protein n=1 Tax=Roseobacter sp. HKCCD7581 TaxID=2690505 RepID=UPI001490B44D
MTGGTITVADGNSEGVSAFTGGVAGNVTAEMSGNSKIVTQRGELQNHLTPAGAVAAYAHSQAYTGTVVARIIDESEHRNQTIITAAGTGVRAVTRGEGGKATASMAGGIINIDGGDAYGVAAGVVDTALYNSEADAEAFMTGGRITTNGTRAVGVRAHTSRFGDAFVQMDETHHASRITTHGWQAHGLQAFSTSTHDDSEGAATAVMKAGTIHINGDEARGAYAQANGGKGTALVQMNNGSIRTTGWDSHGLYARIDKEENDKVVRVEMTGGSIVTYNAPGRIGGSHGIYADTSGSGNVVVEMVGGTVTTIGRNSHGIWAESEAPTQSVEVEPNVRVRFLKPDGQSRAKTFVTLGEDAVVTASGEGSDGIRVSGNFERLSLDSDEFVQLGANGFDVDVDGTVTGGAGSGAAIRTISSASGTIDIASTATVKAGDSGIAIHTETARSSGDVSEDDDGSAVINAAGTIEGDILLDAGDDILNLTSGSITGDIYGGDGDNILNLTGGSFTGNIYAGAGNDTVTISAATEYDGSYILDGGAGTNDRLTLHGQTIRNTADNFRNWEHVTLNDTTLNLEGMDRLDTNLSIDAGSEFRAFGQQSDTPTVLTIAGDVTNNDGSVVLSVQNGTTGDEIKIEGNYTGSDTGSDVFALDMGRDADGVNTDTVVITGNTSGEMTLLIAGLDSAGVEGAPLVMDVVTVGGGEANGTFTLVGGNYVTSEGEQAMISGAYLYRLAETDRGWALSARSESGEINWGPSAPIYDSYGAALLAFNGPSALRGRGSSQDFRSLAWGGQGAQTSGSPLWIQMGTEQLTSAAEQSTTGAARDSSLWEMEIGADLVLSESAAGLLVGGLMLSYGTGSTDVSSGFGDGSIETTGLGLGLAATWYDTRGFYVDGQVTVTSYSSDLSSDSLGSLIEGNSGTGYALSIEAGQQLDLGSRLSVIPQAQLSLSSVTFSDFTGEARGEQRVALSEASSQQLRLGLEFEAQDQGA